MPNGCTVGGGAQVAPGLNTAGAITAAFVATGPGGNTPTTLAITRGGDYLASLVSSNPRFLVLVTDGSPTCGGGVANAPDDAAAIAAVATQATRGFGTFVVGLATGADALATSTLTAMSTNGLHPRAGTPTTTSQTTRRSW